MAKLLTHRRKVLIIETDKHLEQVSESGLIIPRDAGIVSETGTVKFSENGSKFKEGDIVTFRKINREDEFPDHEEIVVDGVFCDAIYEDKIWTVNDDPCSFIFIKPLSEISISEEELKVPEYIKGIPQKGLVISAPSDSFVKKGDTVQYRKREGEVYPQAVLDGVELDVLTDRHIFTVNGKVSPYRIVIRIDKDMQRVSRTTAENGLALSPLFIKMLHNLQYGVCTEIGEKAQEIYPDIYVGDTLILHHSFEEDDYRILIKQKGPLGNVKFEYRIANCFDVNSREIFGRIDKKGKEPKQETVVPFGDYVFLKWEIDLFNKKSIRNSDFITSFEFDIDNCKNIDSLLTTCSKLKEDAADKYGVEYVNLVNEFKTKNPEDEQQFHEAQVISNKIEAMKREAKLKGNELHENHLVIATISSGSDYAPGTKVIIRYRGPYPITIQKKKYLIVSKKDLLATYQTENMTTVIKPTLDRILIEPTIIKQEDGALQIPDTLQELPRTGKVVGVGDLAIGKPGFPSVDDNVLFRRGRGVELKLNDKTYLLMGQDDVLCILSEKE